MYWVSLHLIHTSHCFTCLRRVSLQSAAVRSFCLVVSLMTCRFNHPDSVSTWRWPPSSFVLSSNCNTAELSTDRSDWQLLRPLSGEATALWPYMESIEIHTRCLWGIWTWVRVITLLRSMMIHSHLSAFCARRLQFQAFSVFNSTTKCAELICLKMSSLYAWTCMSESTSWLLVKQAIGSLLCADTATQLPLPVPPKLTIYCPNRRNKDNFFMFLQHKHSCVSSKAVNIYL